VHVDDAKFIAENDVLENEFVSEFTSQLKTSDSGICNEFLKTICQEEDYVSFD
jgi:hypothetical protein